MIDKLRKNKKKFASVLRIILFNISVKFMVSFIFISGGIKISIYCFEKLADPNYSIFIFGVLIIGVWVVIGGIYIFVQAMKYSKIEDMFMSLTYWVNRNDIGSATNLVSSLSENEKIKQYFEERLRSHRNMLRGKSYFYMMNEQSYLVDSIQEIVKELDDITIESLRFLKIYTEFEPKNKSINERIINSVLGISFFGGVLACFKYGIDLFIDKSTQDVGKIVILVTAISFSTVMLIVYFMYRRGVKEKNARNFLLLVFKALEQKEKQINMCNN